MKLFSKLAALAAAAVAACSAGQAAATAYVRNVSTTISSSSAVAASASPGVISATGWNDVSGSVWALNATNGLINTRTSSGNYNLGLMARAAGEDVSVGEKVEVDFLAGSVANQFVYDVCEYNHTATTPSEYMAGTGSGGNVLVIYKNTAGTSTQVAALSGSTTSGNSYTLRLECTPNGSSTTVVATLLGTGGTQAAQLSYVDASSPFTSGGVGFFESTPASNTGWPISAMRTYSANGTTGVTIPVSSTAFHFSPGNWKGDTGRGGSVYRQSWNNGAYFTAAWTAGATPSATLLLPTTASSNKLSYYLNGALVDNVYAGANLDIPGVVANAANTLTVVLRNSTQASRWNNGTNTVQVQGLQVDGGASAGVAAVPAKGWVEIIGDSITEGIEADGGLDSAIKGYSFLLGQSLTVAGYDYGVSACGFSDWIHTGDNTNDVPAWYSVSGGSYSAANSRWSLIDQGQTILDSNSHLSGYGATGQEPAAIVINYGTNSWHFTLSVSDMQASMVGWITAARASAPLAKILVIVPFGLESSSPTYANALKAAVTSYQSANPGDPNVKLIDLGQNVANMLELGGGFYTNNDSGTFVHPTGSGHALVAPAVSQAVLSALQASSPTFRPTFFH